MNNQKLLSFSRVHIIVVLFLVLAGMSTLNAQIINRFMFAAQGGATISWMQKTGPELFQGLQMRPWWGPEFGGIARYNLHRRWFVEGQLGFNHVSARTYLKGTVTDGNGLPTGETYLSRSCYNFSYLSMPLMIGLNMDWWQLMIGMQGNLGLGATLRTWGEGSIDGIPFSYDSRENLNRYGGLAAGDVGPKAIFIAPISSRFAIDLGYFHGLIPVNPGSVTPWYVREFSYGLRYYFWNGNRRNYDY